MASMALDLTASVFREDGQPFLSARRVADTLGVTLSELAALIGVARTTLTAKTGARRVDSALSPLVRIITMAADMAGDEGRAAIWFKHQPLPGWGGKTALDLVRDGKGGTVLDYLESVRAGVYA
ncbi:antitoxin Xre/MbcA/ParS toxin-binding domain-containing protein [Bosea sp. PAMC 26642]|uniref:antitoxin Xre/MbcA/ParS toxin-binding domain-containing protein n=1 Tax=Bosea sp. (strain PAMC 26642) TaxID=1792307 RepID=UPI00077002BA|nr:antitoxin Xre/MbcA/ParS toxin-binding domain-containing protein [Bosea sp. PAMC 26642]AMJ62676.1 transcriptional regulator [Bosea sp. PAMC 26642]